jgi:hypothetical protein
VRSGLWLTMDKSPALINSICHRVSLDNGEGSPAAYFQILPRFKVRSLGSPVYREDEVFLQSAFVDVSDERLYAPRNAYAAFMRPSP